MNVLNEDEWGDLECLYNACQAAITDEGFILKDTAWRKINEMRVNDRVKMTMR